MFSLDSTYPDGFINDCTHSQLEFIWRGDICQVFAVFAAATAVYRYTPLAAQRT